MKKEKAKFKSMVFQIILMVLVHVFLLSENVFSKENVFYKKICYDTLDQLALDKNVFLREKEKSMIIEEVKQPLSLTEQAIMAETIARIQSPADRTEIEQLICSGINVAMWKAVAIIDAFSENHRWSFLLKQNELWKENNPINEIGSVFNDYTEIDDLDNKLQNILDPSLSEELLNSVVVSILFRQCPKNEHNEDDFITYILKKTAYHRSALRCITLDTGEIRQQTINRIINYFEGNEEDRNNVRIELLCLIGIKGRQTSFIDQLGKDSLTFIDASQILSDSPEIVEKLKKKHKIKDIKELGTMAMRINDGDLFAFTVKAKQYIEIRQISNRAERIEYLTGFLPPYGMNTKERFTRNYYIESMEKSNRFLNSYNIAGRLYPEEYTLEVLEILKNKRQTQEELSKFRLALVHVAQNINEKNPMFILIFDKINSIIQDGDCHKTSVLLDMIKAINLPSVFLPTIVSAMKIKATNCPDNSNGLIKTQAKTIIRQWDQETVIVKLKEMQQNIEYLRYNDTINDLIKELTDSEK